MAPGATKPGVTLNIKLTWKRVQAENRRGCYTQPASFSPEKRRYFG